MLNLFRYAVNFSFSSNLLKSRIAAELAENALAAISLTNRDMKVACWVLNTVSKDWNCSATIGTEKIQYSNT